MKRTAITLEALAERKNLELAAWKAFRGKAQHAAVVAWTANADRNFTALGQSILDGTAPVGRMTRFVIHDPKQRVISAACLADRVLHHAIMNLAEARFERALSSAAFACRLGLGVHGAVRAVQGGLQCAPWVVHVDVDGYFPSIDHAVLRARLRGLFKGEPFLALLDRIIELGSPSAGRGLPIGSLTSQHFANHLLSTGDRLLQATPGVLRVVRYMDDIVWCCASRDVAVQSLAALRTHLHDALHLRLKDRVVLRPSGDGLRFCGFNVAPGRLLPSARKRSRYRDAVRRAMRAEAAGADERHLQRAHDAQQAALLPAQTLRWRRSLWWPKP